MGVVVITEEVLVLVEVEVDRSVEVEVAPLDVDVDVVTLALVLVEADDVVPGGVEADDDVVAGAVDNVLELVLVDPVVKFWHGAHLAFPGSVIPGFVVFFLSVLGPVIIVIVNPHY